MKISRLSWFVLLLASLFLISRGNSKILIDPDNNIASGADYLITGIICFLALLFVKSDSKKRNYHNCYYRCDVLHIIEKVIVSRKTPCAHDIDAIFACIDCFDRIEKDPTLLDAMKCDSDTKKLFESLLAPSEADTGRSKKEGT